MINNAEYLIQKYAEARENFNAASVTDTASSYWRGVMDTYRSLLILGFNDWAEQGTTGYYVFIEQKTYDEAINLIHKSLQDA
jgi:hypothetical protein